MIQQHKLENTGSSSSLLHVAQSVSIMNLCNACRQAVHEVFPRGRQSKPLQSSFQTFLPRLDPLTYNDCWICYQHAKWLRTGRRDLLEYWHKQELSVEYKGATLMAAHFPILSYFLEWFFGPMKSIILTVDPFKLAGNRDTSPFAIGISSIRKAGKRMTENSGVRCPSLTELVFDDFSEINTAADQSFSELPRFDLATLDRWIKTCETHELCNSPISEPWHPPRLIEIAANGRSAKLVLTQTATTTISAHTYITLSHRWGGFEYEKLQARNLESFQREIQVLRLPQVFQDTFIIASRLGICHVWIDSLCIIQEEDEVDWKQQCQIMGKVYSNAYMNVSATAFDKDEGSLLLRPSPRIIQKPIEISFKTWYGINKEYVMDTELWHNEVLNAPLNQRGWVFQERLLARRILHFGTNQLAWECRQSDALETFPQGLPSTMCATSVSKQDFCERLEESEPKAQYSLWTELVEDYSKCKLSRAKDKLIALDGLANYFKMYLGDEYAAGMWRSNLTFDLAWYAGYDGEVPSSRDSTEAALHAPTWSWASVDGEVTFSPFSNILRVRERHVDTIDFALPSTQYSKEDHANRALTLEGNLLPICFDWDGQSLRGFTIGRILDFPICEQTMHTDPTASKFYPDIPLSDIRKLKKLGYLPLFTDERFTYGIVLSGIPHSGNEYRRIGYVQLPLLMTYESSPDVSDDKEPSGLLGHWVPAEVKAPEGILRSLWYRLCTFVIQRGSQPLHRHLWNVDTYRLVEELKASHEKRHSIVIR